MTKVIFKLKEPKSEKATLIYLIFSFGYSISDAEGKNRYKFLKISTGEKIHPKFWKDKPVYRAKSTSAFPEHPELNTRLNFLETSVNNAYRRLVNNGINNPKPKQIREEYAKEISDEPRSVDSFGVIDFIKKYIEENKSLKRPNTIKKYKTTQKHLEDFSKSKGVRLEFEDIDMKFYSEFHQYLVIENGYTTNTFGKYIATLKGFLNAAFEQGAKRSIEYSTKRFKVLSEDVDKIYLNQNELDSIYKLDLSKDKKLERVRDMFILECNLGLRFSDLSSLTEENIYTLDEKMFIKVKTRKTDEVIICPMNSVSKEVFRKYKNHLPKVLSNQKTNEYLKEIGKKAKLMTKIKTSKTIGGELKTTVSPKYELITTHTARRSFASNAYLAGIPTLSIMKITGHRTEQSFLRYIRISPEENAMKLLEHDFFK